MNPHAIACAVSERVEAAIASPFAVPAYLAASVALARTMPDAAVTVALSHFANLVLLLLAIGQRRQGRLVADGVLALAAANPAVDERAIERNAR